MANRDKIVVLLIDDDPDIRKYLGMSLSYNNMEVITAEDGKMGLDLLLGDVLLRPDAIICDINMPNMNGMEFLAEVGSNRINTPVIISSGSDTDAFGGEEGIIRMGAAALVPKPIKTDVMVGKIRDLVFRLINQRECAADA